MKQTKNRFAGVFFIELTKHTNLIEKKTNENNIRLYIYINIYKYIYIWYFIYKFYFCCCIYFNLSIYIVINLTDTRNYELRKKLFFCILKYKIIIEKCKSIIKSHLEKYK